MKILFYIHGFSGGGAERVMATLVNYYHDKGDLVSIGCDTSAPSVYNLPPCPIFNIREGCYSQKRISRLHSYRFIHMLHNIRTIAERESPDVIVSFITDMNIFVLIALIGLRFPIIVCEHTNISRKIGLFKIIFRRLMYPLASAVTVLTRRDYKLWRKKFNNVVYMPNPCDKQNFALNNIKRGNVILAAGRVDQWYIKGFDLLIKAWSNISQNHPGWELHIAGNTTTQSISELSAVVSNFEKHHIKFLGFRNDVYDLMKCANIFVLSSRTEGLPMVLIEAMNAGDCCIAFDIRTGPNEIIRHEFNGILVPEGDTNAMQNWISKLITDVELRNRLSANAPKSMKKYSLERIMNRWDILFKTILIHKHI